MFLIRCIKNHLGGQWSEKSYVVVTNIEVTGGKEPQELSSKSAKKLRWQFWNNPNKDYNKIKGAGKLKRIVVIDPCNENFHRADHSHRKREICHTIVGD